MMDHLKLKSKLFIVSIPLCIKAPRPEAPRPEESWAAAALAQLIMEHPSKMVENDRAKVLLDFQMKLSDRRWRTSSSGGGKQGCSCRCNIKKDAGSEDFSDPIFYWDCRPRPEDHKCVTVFPEVSRWNVTLRKKYSFIMLPGSWLKGVEWRTGPAMPESEERELGFWILGGFSERSCSAGSSCNMSAQPIIASVRAEKLLLRSTDMEYATWISQYVHFSEFKNSFQSKGGNYL